jgi:voltage-gated potassium channel
MPETEHKEKEPNIFIRFFNRFRKKRFSYLAKSLILLLLAYPYLERDLIGQITMTVITIAVMLSLVIAVSDGRRSIFIALCLAVPWFVTLLTDSIPHFEPESTVLISKEIVFAILLFFYTTIRIFIHLIRSREVTSEILFAAVCVYLLIGLSWASLYIFLEILKPGSFIDTAGDMTDSPPRFLFFSYVTLTTVGYGTLAPTTDQARSVCTMEAIVGQLYLTIMVARLVGLHISKPRVTKEGD